MNGYIVAGYLVILGSLLLYTLRLRARTRSLRRAVGDLDDDRKDGSWQ